MENIDSENKVTIIVDTGSDMLPEEAEKLGIVLLPLTVRFGNEEFADGFTLSRDEFYTRLEQADVIPKTSLISPAVYEEHFQKEVEAGKDVVCLTLSSGISGCYQSALLAAENFEGHVHVVDTKQFCGTEYLLAERAVELRNQGASAAEIAAVLDQEKEKICIIAVFDTLKYLKMGGRISGAAACIGGLLSIKPVLTITKGMVDLIGKARGSKNSHNHLIRFVQERGGIDWNKPILLSWSGKDPSALDKYLADSTFLYEGKKADELPRSRVGATIGTYTGSGAIALSFYPLGK